MADFLLELLSEEIPARMQAKARNDLARMFAEHMIDVGLAHGALETYSTPRRLVLIARDLAEATETVTKELKGPKVGAPDQAVDGFLKKNGLTREQLEERSGTYFAHVVRTGQRAAEILKVRIPVLIWRFPWPTSMRWGPASASSASLTWVRPLQGVVAIHGDKIVPFSLDMAHLWEGSEGQSAVTYETTGLTSGATTVGHRFHHPGPITIGGADDYFEKLRACHVIVDQEERERIIREGAVAAASSAGLTLIEDEGLVVENAGLTEWPVPLLGRFDPEFLDVPREVIVLTMRTNQRYFACAGGDGGLAPAFVCVANIDASDGGASIVEGNKRVLAARLSDARFFWEQDLKVPLDEQAKKLGGIVFHEKLGTVADKVERIAKLARWLVEEGIVKGANADEVERAARLAKADLVSGMVGEFPELQGVIGGYLAERQGEPKAVADAIRDHYGTPSKSASIAVALADKLDTIAVFFGIDQRPTGSKDPFALRRAALGSIELIVGNGLRLSLTRVVRGALANRAGQTKETDAAHRLDRTAPEVLAFFADRLKVQQREAGVRHDLIDAVFALGGEDDLVRLLARVKALQAFVETDEGRDLHAGYKRAANILKKEKWDAAAASDGDVAAEEAALTSALDAAEPNASAAIEAEDFTAAMSALASLRAPIDAFFDKVTVNADDKGVRARRLNLLARFRDAVNRVADFSKIEG